MNIIRREWKSYRRQTIYWTIGLLLLLCISFYKMDGLSNTPGGIDTIMKSLPPALQIFFGSTTNAGTGIGIYQMIHLYLAIALSLHAVILGSHIFAKEEHDKTFEFLYVKGVKRVNIMLDKMIAGIMILLVLDLVSLIGVYASIMMMHMSLTMMEILPYLCALFLMQLFFFSISLLISLFMKNNQKAGMVGCSVVFIMFMVTMYVKMGGQMEMLDKLSIFHYTDANYIEVHGNAMMPTLIMSAVSFIGFISATYLHEYRDLLC